MTQVTENPEASTAWTAPPSPAPKRRRRWPWIVLGVVVVFGVIAAAMPKDDKASTDATEPAASVSDPAPETPAAPTEVPEQADTPAPAPETPANDPGMSMAEFDAITEGMTREQVTAIVGSEGEILSESNIADYETVMVTWEGESGFGANANANVPERRAHLQGAVRPGVTASAATRRRHP